MCSDHSSFFFHNSPIYHLQHSDHESDPGLQRPKKPGDKVASSPVPRSLSAFLTSCTFRGFTSWAMNRKSKSQVVSRDSYKTSPPPHKKWTLPVQVAHPSPRKVRNALPPRRPFVSYSLLPGYSTWSNDLGMPGDDA